MEKKACIFDMDGTLVDSMGYWRTMQREYLSAWDAEGEKLAAVMEEARLLPLHLSTALFIRTFHIPQTPEEMTAEMTKRMEVFYREKAELKPGAEEYLRTLKARDAKLCIASATAKALVECCMARLGVLDCFDFIISCTDVGAGKDKPDIFLEAARRLGCAPEETVVFEDSLQAVETAKRAGFGAVGVYDASNASVWEQLAPLADEAILDWWTATV